VRDYACGSIHPGGVPLPFLLLAVLCSASVALLLRWSGGRGLDGHVVTTANYAAAVTISLLLLFTGGLPTTPGTASLRSFSDEIGGVLRGGTFGAEGGSVWALVSGIPAGVFYYLGIVMLQASIRECGTALSAGFSKMGVLVPMALSLLLWGEIPGVVQWAGIILALLSILAGSVGFPRGGDRGTVFRPVLLMLFLSVGMAEFSNKAYQGFAAPGFRSLFLLAVFGTALALSGIRTARSAARISRGALLAGLAVGIPNYFASFFLIAALSGLSAAIVFPAYGALTICLVALSGRLLFGERLTPRERISVALAVCATILVNLGGRAT